MSGLIVFTSLRHASRSFCLRVGHGVFCWFPMGGLQTVDRGMTDQAVKVTMKFETGQPLLEDLAVRPLVLLAVDGDGLVPRPLILDESLVLGLGGVELGKLV